MSMDISTAAGAGKLELLVALRDHIAAAIDDGVAPRDLASLSLRLLAISEEIDELRAAKDGDEVADAASAPDEEWDPS